jgi:ribosome-associated heat shock protein Hsp15
MAKTKIDISVRLDKWMWSSRCYKTRVLARTVIQSGKVKYNGQSCKPSKIVETGALVRFPQGYDIIEVEILEILDKRQSATIAAKMYRETEPSIVKRQQNDEARKSASFHSPHPESKPDKKARRELMRLKGHE